MYSPVPAQPLPLTSNSTFVPFSQDTNKKGQDAEKSADVGDDTSKQPASNSETLTKDNVESKVQDNLQETKDHNLCTEGQKEQRDTGSTGLIPVVQLPPVQMNTIQISVYPWQCLVPQLMNFPASSVTPHGTCDVPSSQDGQKSVANQPNGMETAESVSDVTLSGVEGINHDVGAEKRENRATTVAGPNTRKRTRSASVSSQDDGKPAAKVQVWYL